ncbi:MAG TPA: ATP-binding cassette domain-containing protein [Streptosporangiaceae bacterium]
MMQVTTSPPLLVDGLTKTYPGGVRAVRGISFEVAEGEIFGLLGPNGAGKTTTLGVLTTLVRPSGGRAMVAGLDVTREPLAARRAMGVVFQDSVLDNDFSGLANMRLHARLWRVPEDRIAGLLDAVGLTARASDGVRTYSGGMKRRLEIARALLGRPRILLLDEPTLGLDPIVRSELWAMIRTLQATRGVTVLVSTHYLEEAQSVCDRVAIIDQGEIIALDRPAKLIDDLGQHVLEVGAGADPERLLGVLRQAPPGLREPMSTGSTISVPSWLPAPELTELASQLDLAGAGATTISIRPATLNDVFLYLTSAARANAEGAA